MRLCTIKVQYEEQPFVIQAYKQDQWVILQKYHIEYSEERLSYLCDKGSTQQETLEWLLKEYLKHHPITNQI